MGIGEVTILGMIVFHQITLEKELHLVDLAVFVSEVVLFGILFANVDQFANADFGADFFKDFTLERLVQGLSEFLTTARQNGVSASAILLAQNEQLAILDDDSFDGIPQFLFLRHFVRILPHNLPTVIQRYRARCSHKGKAMFPKKTQMNLNQSMKTFFMSSITRVLTRSQISAMRSSGGKSRCSGMPSKSLPQKERSLGMEN